MVRRTLLTLGVLALVCGPAFVLAQAKSPAKPTDLDTLMAQALERRDIDRKILDDYILDETATFSVVGPDRAPLYGTRRDYSYYVRDGFHIRSPLRVDGVPVAEADRRAYEEKWLKSEQNRRKYRTERAQKREEEGRPAPPGIPSINEPRFVSEAYFLDFRFEPGNYYLAGREKLDGQDVLKIDYYPRRLFRDEPEADRHERQDREKQQKERPKQSAEDLELERKLNKTSVVTIWVDPAIKQIVKYSFQNVRLDFLPARWLVEMQDLTADMEMAQPFPGVWLPEHVQIHGAAMTAAGSVALTYTRDFSNYRRADVKTKITVPKKDGK